MADSKISNLPSTTTIVSTDLLTIVQGGANKKIDAGSSGIVYSDIELTTEAIGGLPSGSDITEQNACTILKRILVKYQSPSFNSFSISSQSNPLEVGDSVSGTKTFTWTTSNNGNVQANSVNIYKVTGGVVALLTGLANDGEESYAFPTPILSSIAGSYTWRIQGTDTQLSTFNKDYTVNWYWLLHYGTSANTTLTETQIKALTGGLLTSTTARTYNFAAGGYKYLCVNEDLPQPTSFKDLSTLLEIPFESAITVSVTNVNSITSNYKVYRSTNILGAAVSIMVA